MLIGGDRKMIVYNDLEADEKVKLYDKGVDIDSEKGAFKALLNYRTGNILSPLLDQYEALNFECQHFIECIKEKITPITDGITGRDVVNLLVKSNESLNKNGAFVKLGEGI